jgi:hypothetical protein
MRLEIPWHIWNFIYIYFEILQLECPLTHTGCGNCESNQQDATM